MHDGGGGRMLPPADRPRLPLMYGLSARETTMTEERLLRRDEIPWSGRSTAAK